MKRSKRPSIMNVGSSDWDAFYSKEHSCEYYHNKKTGETRWTCPPEISSKLGNQSHNTTAEAISVTDVRIAVAFKGQQQGKQKPASTWMQFYTDRGPYYCNVETQEVSWTLPAGATLQEGW